MAERLIFDCETDGLLPELTKLHCLCLYNLDDGSLAHYADQPGHTPILEGIARLQAASLAIGHNILGFDNLAIQKVYGVRVGGLQRDTLVLSALMWPHIKENDFKLAATGMLPGQYIGRHALAAWGWRLGVLKGEYSGGWDTWSPDMHDYMIQDVRVTVKLWEKIVATAAKWGVELETNEPTPGKDCVELEHRVAAICLMVEKHGFSFDKVLAASLAGELTGKLAALTESLQAQFPPREVATTFIPKVNNKTRGYEKGVPFIKRTPITFNPGSRQEVARRLTDMGWVPIAFGANGHATVDDDILSALAKRFPQASVLADYYTIDKRLGQVANGKEAWLRHERRGRIHGRIAHNGAHTGRMTHSKPNVAQVPGNHALYGETCRACFTADPGHTLMGCDADALELRDLAGYMALYDGGAYIQTVLKGDKKLGTDMHSINARIIGCDRDTAKTFFYALIYGSGDANLGNVLGLDGKKAFSAGRKARLALMRGVPALGKLVEAVKSVAETRGYLVGIDGRRLNARAANAALNTLLQSAGAVQMKRGLVFFYDRCLKAGFKWGVDFAIVGLIHDEWQVSCRTAIVNEIGNIAVQAIRDAGTYYNFRCPLEAQFKIGATWKDTH